MLKIGETFYIDYIPKPYASAEPYIPSIFNRHLTLSERKKEHNSLERKKRKEFLKYKFCVVDVKDNKIYAYDISDPSKKPVYTFKDSFYIKKI